jgi:hypothetical protein
MVFSEDTSKPEAMFMIAMLISVTWLSGLTYLSYQMSWGFMCFLNVMFGSTLVRATIWGIVAVVNPYKKKDSKDEKTSLDK